MCVCLCVYIWVYFEFIDRGSSNLSLYSARKSDKLFNQTFSHRFHCQWDIFLYSNSFLSQGFTDNFVLDGVRIISWDKDEKTGACLHVVGNNLSRLKFECLKLESPKWSWNVSHWKKLKFENFNWSREVFVFLKLPDRYFSTSNGNFRTSESEVETLRVQNFKVLKHLSTTSMCKLFSKLLLSNLESILAWSMNPCV